jgi:hypothetical protein
MLDPTVPQTSPEATAPPNWAELTADVLCPLCTYNLRGLTESRCPECGYGFAWAEVLDSRRRLHPYLFEHHPERNIRSYWRTVVGALRPIHFWTSLHPIQPSNRRRLVLYIALQQVFYLLAVAGMFLLSNLLIEQARNANIASDNSSTTARFNAATPARRQWIIRQYGSMQAYLAATQSPNVTFAQVLKARIDHRDFLAEVVGVIVIPLAWPWLTYFTLRIFRVSMRRARLNTTHFLRCVVYSFDSALWAALFGVGICAAGAMFGGQRSAIEILVCAGTTIIWVLGTLYSILRLWAAYRLYLRFQHAFATVILSQIVVGLVAANVAFFATVWLRY